MTSETDDNGHVFSDEEVSGKGGLPREDSSFFDETEDWTEHGDVEETPAYSRNTTDEPAVSSPPKSTPHPGPRPSPRNQNPSSPFPSQQRSRTALQVMLRYICKRVCLLLLNNVHSSSLHHQLEFLGGRVASLVVRTLV